MATDPTPALLWQIQQDEMREVYRRQRERESDPNAVAVDKLVGDLILGGVLAAGASVAYAGYKLSRKILRR